MDWRFFWIVFWIVMIPVIVVLPSLTIPILILALALWSRAGVRNQRRQRSGRGSYG